MSTTSDLPPLPEKRPISGQAGLNCVIWGKGHDDETLEAYAREAVRLDREHDKPLKAALEALGAMRARAEKAEARVGKLYGEMLGGAKRAGSVPAGWDTFQASDDTRHPVLYQLGCRLANMLNHPQWSEVEPALYALADALAPSTPPNEATSRDAEPQIGETWHILRSGALACATVKIAAMTDKTVTFESGIYGIDNECLPRAKFAFVERVDAARTQGDAA